MSFREFTIVWWAPALLVGGLLEVVLFPPGHPRKRILAIMVLTYKPQDTPDD